MITLPHFPLPAEPIPLWVLMGGMSPEHDISLSSALTALRQFEPDRYRVRPVCIRRDGQWCLAPELWPAPLSETQCGALRAEFTADAPAWPCVPEAEALARAASDQIALAVIIMHGPQGEDGQIQRTLKTAGINFTGSGVEASALAMDKRHCQRRLQQLGVPVPRFQIIERARWKRDPAAVQRDVIGDLGAAQVVKDIFSGSSVGVFIVRDTEAWARAVTEAFAPGHDAVLCEQFIAGTEVTCGVLEIPRGAEIEIAVLPATEIIPREGEFFDRHCKYSPGATDEITPARLSEEITAEVQALARQVHEAVGARGFSRTDFMIPTGGHPLVIEINTIPGLTPTSLLPQEAAAVGITYPQLLTTLVEGAHFRPVV